MLRPGQQSLEALPLVASRIHNAVYMLLIALPTAVVWHILNAFGYSQPPARLRAPSRARSTSRPRSTSRARTTSRARSISHAHEAVSSPVLLPVDLPSTLPVLGNLFELANEGPRLHDWFAELSEQFDTKPFALHMPGKADLVVISSPSHFEGVQKSFADNFIKGANFHDMLSDLLGDSLFIVNGDQWKHQRRILAKLFSTRSLRCHMAPIVQRQTKNLLKIVGSAANSGELVSLSDLMHQFTLNAFSEIAFGINISSFEQSSTEGSRRFENAFDEAQELVADRFRVPAAWWKLLRILDIGTERRIRKALEIVNAETAHFISESMERRQRQLESGEETTTQDLISLIIDAMSEDGGEVNTATVRDLVVTSLMAGRDTTADTMSWFMLVLSEHPHVADEICAELRGHLPQLFEDPDFVPNADEVQNLPYLEASIQEVMRLYPAGPFTVKQCIRDTVLADGTLIHAGSDVGLAVYAMGRSVNVWGDDAKLFRPERFLEESTSKDTSQRWQLQVLSPFKFSAFSAGARQCVGRRLASLEMKVALASLLSRFSFEAVAPQSAAQQTYTPGITLTMKIPLQMRVRARV